MSEFPELYCLTVLIKMSYYHMKSIKNITAVYDLLLASWQ